MTYNGFANQETFTVQYWLHTDPRYKKRIAAALARGRNHDERKERLFFCVEGMVRARTAGVLAFELVLNALSRVNWDEVYATLDTSEDQDEDDELADETDLEGKLDVLLDRASKEVPR